METLTIDGTALNAPGFVHSECISGAAASTGTNAYGFSRSEVKLDYLTEP